MVIHGIFDVFFAFLGDRATLREIHPGFRSSYGRSIR
jgi:hypothetical protein